MCVHICVCVYVCACVCARVCVYVYVCVSVDGCVHGSVHISGIVHSLYTCTCIRGCNEYKYKYKLHRPRGSKFEQWYGCVPQQRLRIKWDKFCYTLIRPILGHRNLAFFSRTMHEYVDMTLLKGGL